MESHFRVGFGEGISPRLYYFDNTGEGGDGRIYIGYIGKRITTDEQVGHESPGSFERRPLPVAGNGPSTNGSNGVLYDSGMDPYLMVGGALRFLAERLAPIIQSRLGEKLKGQDWTEILTELAIQRGGRLRRFSGTDPQAQIRLLTERLGDLGYPFDEWDSHTVSTHGKVLRSLRNRYAHNHSLVDLDAFRTLDHIALLLDELGDEEGANEASTRRDALFLSLRNEEQETARSGFARVSQADESRESRRSESEAETPAEREAVEAAVLVGRPSVLSTDEIAGVETRKKTKDSTPLIGAGRAEYEPWVPSGLGIPEVIQSVGRSDGASREVLALVEAVVNYEGPISLTRLVDLVGKECGYSSLHHRRRAIIENEIRQFGLHVDYDRFVWPEDIDPRTWTEFRPSHAPGRRDVRSISPVEIANAANAVLEEKRDLTVGELSAAVSITFGESILKNTSLQYIEKSLKHLAKQEVADR